MALLLVLVVVVVVVVVFIFGCSFGIGSDNAGTCW